MLAHHSCTAHRWSTAEPRFPGAPDTGPSFPSWDAASGVCFLCAMPPDMGMSHGDGLSPWAGSWWYPQRTRHPWGGQGPVHHLLPKIIAALRSLISKTPTPVGGNSFRQKAESSFHGDRPGSGFHSNTYSRLPSFLFMST